MKKTEMDQIRNFSIIAHIDHGKSTLADRLLEITGALTGRDLKDQALDTMELEREKGITIKAQTARLGYSPEPDSANILNLIDTPGHVDFSYEVSRSLAACEGVLLVIDAAQGIEAQTMANTYLAFQSELVIIPIINKIDLPQADIPLVTEQIKGFIGMDEDEILLTSAKKGTGIEKVLEAVVHRIPPPKGDPDAPLKALLFDSWYDPYKGVTVLIRVFDGSLRPGTQIQLMSSGAVYKVEEVGFLTPFPKKAGCLSSGEVGYVMAQIKDLSHARIGDTITEKNNPVKNALPGFREAKPMVFCGMYPTQETSVVELRKSLEKLRLNDFSFLYEPENSPALGMGFRCGFLGLLHKDIIQERLEREFGLNLVSTAPNVSYRVTTKDGNTIEIHSPSQLPPSQKIKQIEEPVIEAMILTPDPYLGPLLKLLDERRGQQKKLEYISPQRVYLSYRLPLNEIIFNFYDRLKSLSQGYASMDYEMKGFQPSSLVKLDILVNGDQVDALSLIVHSDKAYSVGKRIIERMKNIIPRQQYAVALQAALGNRIISRETIKPYRKDVLAKLYGGDYTRKMKLLEKQKSGKQRMKKIGRVDIPQEAFLAVLEIK